MTMFRLISAVLISVVTPFILVSAADAQAPGVADRCFGCHTEDGVTDNPNIPTIAGVGDFYIENQLTIFAEKARPCITGFLPEGEVVNKCALIGALSESQRAALVEYFAGLDFEPFEQPVDAALAERGAVIHAENCERCHTENGTVSMDDSAILAGQPKQYLARQLRNFRAGKRWQLESMAAEIEDLEDDDIDALVNFYAGVAQ
ncbi:MAG TPA: c-type cytochrome [Wenzhouxiangellaceae bacterium]|nr:c-type cytochrome [Wenzhouxiangellaceae bacterium]